MSLTGPLIGTHMVNNVARAMALALAEIGGRKDSRTYAEEIIKEQQRFCREHRILSKLVSPHARYRVAKIYLQEGK